MQAGFLRRVFAGWRGLGLFWLIILAVLLFCPTVLFDQGQVALAPASFVCLVELLARDPVAALHAALPLLFVSGISLLVDAARRDRACPDDKP